MAALAKAIKLKFEEDSVFLYGSSLYAVVLKKCEGVNFKKLFSLDIDLRFAVFDYYDLSGRKPMTSVVG